MEDVAKGANLLSRLDRIPVTKSIVGIMFLLILAWIFESFDIGMAGTLIVSLKKAWNLTGVEVGLFGVSPTIGIVLGLIPGGRLADKYGRRKVLLWGIFVYALLTFASAFSPNFETMVALRILAGLGEGAVFPIPYLMLSEFVNSNKRGISIGWVNGVLTAAYSIPLMVGAWASSAFPLENVWKVMSLLGGIPLLYLVPLLLWLPESPRFLIKQGSYEKLEQLIEKLEKRANLPHDTRLINPSTLEALQTGKQAQVRMSAIFAHPYLTRSIIAYLIFAYSIYLFYVINVYGPTIFSGQGLKLGGALTFTAVMMVVGGIGTVVHGHFSDKYGRKTPLVIYAALATIGIVMFAYANSFASLVTAGILSAFFGLSVNPFGKLYISEQYPTDIRGVGAATGEMLARFFSGVMGLYFVPLLLAWGGTYVIFISLGVFIVAANIPMMIWGRNTANKSVEEAGSAAYM
ncbi:MFS transporter [Ferviditalea candida]|uniref:MFS transporter n=1 Tax=Ferviditalea candida TaxID=3108399 RepID=A0ABU5ZGH5_9BACL|nr:MFS transporter [Paenibacillaceae bacterium T2]